MRRRHSTAAFLAAVLCVAVTIAPAARADPSACSTGDSCVVVQIFGAGVAPQRVVQFSTRQLAAFPDQVGGDYDVRPAPGGGRIKAGVPIQELLSQSGVTPGAVSYAYVIGSTAYRSPLSGITHDFDPPDTNDFDDGLQPVFYPIGGTDDVPDTVGYIRPLRKDDPADTNNRDFMQVTRGGAFTVQVHQSGTLLRPTISIVGATTVRVGEAVRLTAKVAEARAGETLDWTWNLADGIKDIDTSTTSALTTPPYSTPGTYYVQAGVTGSEGSSGTSNTVAITVRSRKKLPVAPKTTGPGRGAGPSTNPIGGPVTGTGTRFNGRPGASPGASGGPAAPSATGPSAAATPGPSASGPSAPRSSRPGTAATSSSAAARPSGGRLVAGFALVDLPGASAANQPVRGAPAAAAAARAGGPHVRASLAWVGVACILALLLAGAGLERRRTTPGPKRRHR